MLKNMVKNHKDLANFTARVN